jgi:hypothetical protein
VAVRSSPWSSPTPVAAIATGCRAPTARRKRPPAPPWTRCTGTFASRAATTPRGRRDHAWYPHLRRPRRSRRGPVALVAQGRGGGRGGGFADRRRRSPSLRGRPTNSSALVPCTRLSPRSSGDRAVASGAMCAGSNPAEGAPCDASGHRAEMTRDNDLAIFVEFASPLDSYQFARGPVPSAAASSFRLEMASLRYADRRWACTVRTETTNCSAIC